MTDEAPITAALLRQWPLREPGESKHSRGHALIIGGARATPGAVLLAGVAALRVGAGVLAMAVPDDVAVPLAVTVPEASVSGWGGPTASDIDAAVLDPLLEQADAVTIGPGLDDAQVATALVGHVAASDFSGPVVLDAYALGVLSDLEEKQATALAGRLVLTPNQREAAILLEGAPDDQSDVERARLIARRWDAVVSYAGVVATVAGDAHEVSTGHPGLGTSGSGDVLAGAIGGLLARGADPVRAACWGLYLHAASGDRLAARVGRLGFLARELLDELPLVLTELQA